MNRRHVLAACGSSSTVLFAGCTLLSSDSDLEPIDRPAWPDDPSPRSVVEHVTLDAEAVGYNRALDERDGTHEELSYRCAGVYDAETAAGHVVLTNCHYSETVDPGLFQHSEATHGIVGPTSILAAESSIVRSSVDYVDDLDSVYDDDHDDSNDDEPPSFSTRGIIVVNFAPESRAITVSVADDGATAFDETYDLDSETGVIDAGVIDSPGSYDVTAAVDGEEDESGWQIPDDPREPISLTSYSTLDVGLGVYVLPDGSIEIHELPAERPTA